MIDFEKIKVIAFDADDTLWVNEPHYREAEMRYAQVMIEDFKARKETIGDVSLDEQEAIEYISQELYTTEMGNMELLGYGAKAFTISLVENAIKISGGKVSNESLQKIIAIGKSLLTVKIELLEGVEKTLQYLSLLGKYRIIYVTKGDLLDQGNKLKRSGLKEYFEFDEIMPDKVESNYLRLFKILNIKPEEFVMVGNSLKSDMLPVLNLGGYGVYIPYSIIWQHEMIAPFEHKNMIQLNTITELIGLINFCDSN